jgi:hypothetical protein
MVDVGPNVKRAAAREIGAFMNATDGPTGSTTTSTKR